MLHLPDALSRLGYTNKHSASVVEQLRHRPMEACSVEQLREEVFADIQKGEHIRQLMGAAGTGEMGRIRELSEKLQARDAAVKWAEESEKEESNAQNASMVQSWSAMVSERRLQKNGTRVGRWNNINQDNAIM